MDEKDLELIQQLREENPRYRKLYEKHSLFEKALRGFKDKRYLTPEEEVEKKNLQKLKLAGRDEMEEILTEASE